MHRNPRSGRVLESPDERREYGEVRIIAFRVDDRAPAVVYTMRGRASPHYIGKGEQTAVSSKRIVRRTHKPAR